MRRCRTTHEKAWEKFRALVLPVLRTQSTGFQDWFTTVDASMRSKAKREAQLSEELEAAWSERKRLLEGP